MQRGTGEMEVELRESEVELGELEVELRESEVELGELEVELGDLDASGTGDLEVEPMEKSY
jgi:hypothetical protein